MRITIELPRVGRKRLIGTVVLCSLATTLWIAAPLYVEEIPLVPDADLTVWLVLWGVLVPWSVGAVALLWMEWRITRDLGRVRWTPEPERRLRKPLEEIVR